MRVSREDEVLKRLTIDDIPESCAFLADYLYGDFGELSEEIKRAPYYRGDGLDLMRYLIKHLGGMTCSLPKLNRMRSVCSKYIQDRLAEEPDVTVKRLSLEMNICEKVVREYLRNAVKESI